MASEQEEFEFRARAEREGGAGKAPSGKPGFLANKLGSYMAFMGKEGGYGSNPAGKLNSMVQQPFNKAGTFIAEQLGKRQFPKTGAALGTAVQMAPDIALSIIPSPGPVRAPSEMTKGFLNQLESSSGAMKDSLVEQFKDPTTMFAKGTGAVRPLYQQAAKELPYEQTLFKGLTKHGDIVDKAVETIEKGGKLEPQEALIARKSLDKVKKTLSQDAFNYYRQTLDSVAKSSDEISKADPLFRRGLMGESLRKILPQNKYGGTSAFKTAIGKAGGAMMAPFLSPAVQSVGAGTAGVASRTDPRLVTSILQMLRRRRENPNSQ